MRSVVDTSVAARWCLPDEKRDEDAAQVLDQALRDGIHVPALWPFELFNVLLRALRLGRIDEAGFDRAIVLLSNLNVEVENAPDWDTGQVIFAIAQSQNLTFYDASYLELARRLDLPLATGDEKLQKAGKRMGLRRG